MANKQQRGSREAKKPKKHKPKSDDTTTISGFIDKAREWSGRKK